MDLKIRAWTLGLDWLTRGFDALDFDVSRRGLGDALDLMIRMAIRPGLGTQTQRSTCSGRLMPQGFRSQIDVDVDAMRGHRGPGRASGISECSDMAPGSVHWNARARRDMDMRGHARDGGYSDDSVHVDA